MVYNTDLSRESLQNLNISGQAIKNLLDEINDEKMEVHSLIISKKGKVAFEAYWEPYARDIPHIMYSVSKTFAATIIGILYDMGLVDLFKPLIEYFPQYAHLATGYMKELNLHHLLSMNGGTDYATTNQICCNTDKPDWAANFFEDKLIHKPGTHFEYNTPGSYMLCRTAMEITGIKPLEFLNDHLFNHMSITGVNWDECPLGCNIGGWGMWMKSEDLLKVGLLYLNKGVYNGKRLLSEEWIDKLSSFQSDSANPKNLTQIGYGYQVWLNSIGGFRMYGMYGQFCFVIPEKEMVVVTTGGMSNPNMLADAVLRMINNSYGLTTKEEEIGLKQKVALLKMPPLSSSYIPKLDIGRPVVFKMEENEEGYEELEFVFYKDGGMLTLAYSKEQGGYTCVLPFGYGYWKKGTRVCKAGIRQWTGGVKRTVSSAKWDKNILTLELRFYETAFAEYWKCDVLGDRIVINRKQNCGNHGQVDLETLRGTI